MMYEIKSRHELPNSDIFNAEQETVLITVNTVGAMGRGIAHGLRKRYPDIYRHYKQRCRAGLVLPESLQTYRVSLTRRFLLFPTKIDWRDRSPIDLILRNLDKLGERYEELNIASLAMPGPGMSNGWLRDWERKRVLDKMQAVFSKLPIHVVYYHDGMK